MRKVELSLQERRRGRKVSTGGRFSSSSLRFLSPANGGTEGGVKTIEERLGEKGGAFLNGKEGRVGFRKKSPKYFLEKILLVFKRTFKVLQHLMFRIFPE